MGIEILSKDNVQILEEAKDWKEAIRICIKPLERHGFVEERYKEEIISNIESLGPYIVIGPYIALPHARPEQGVIKSQISITLFKKSIYFGKDEIPAKLFVSLAAKDNESHLDALANITEVLQNEEVVKEILKSKDVDTLYQYFH
ncbi:PTS sugar transporter subunit IIA [Anaerosacchariphilus polymeriproducens]|uniref:PTS sugar transporter subunit IIA n=1 Tax=Anaerosacchariphilus polymeriproducens TaxID=1812858 RepID=UPI001F3EEAFA|nr:PTS sugar transporter subunit IIA [Anaerosacchariphilus polymeriproducens]